MSTSYEDYAYDQYMSDLYEEERVEEAVKEFTVERLRSYYGQNELLAKPAFDFLSEAKKQNELNPTVGLVFAAIAAEVGLKATLFKPIVYGLVHKESAASLITDLTVSRGVVKKEFKNLLFHILQEHGGVDLRTYKRIGVSKTLLEEFLDVKKDRNRVMHRANQADSEISILALNVASEILEKIFPNVVSRMGFHLHNGYIICLDCKCKRRGL